MQHLLRGDLKNAEPGMLVMLVKTHKSFTCGLHDQLPHGSQANCGGSTPPWSVVLRSFPMRDLGARSSTHVSDTSKTKNLSRSLRIRRTFAQVPKADVWA